MVFTRRIEDVALKWLGQFNVELLVNEAPGWEVTVKEIARGSLDDVVGEDNSNNEGQVWPM